jgi:adenylosuccinate synthase
LRGETTWERLGLQPEYTTVTNKERRVGEWDADSVSAAVQANGGSVVNLALTMVDTEIPEVAGVTNEATLPGDVQNELAKYLVRIQAQVGAPVNFIGTGPRTGIFL